MCGEAQDQGLLVDFVRASGVPTDMYATVQGHSRVRTRHQTAGQCCQASSLSSCLER